MSSHLNIAAWNADTRANSSFETRARVVLSLAIYCLPVVRLLPRGTKTHRELFFARRVHPLSER